MGEQIERLQGWVEDLFREVGEVREHADQRIDALAAQTAVEVATLRGDHAALAARVHAEKREDEQLNTDGFPLIALGIIMGGLPDAWLVPAVSGVLLAFAAIVAARAARPGLTARNSTVARSNSNSTTKSQTVTRTLRDYWQRCRGSSNA